ncbi:MAG: YaaL family protein [Lachnospiraceae bacterium]|nr:YaaL family protein [Lachnospiraceae bacterium]
MPSFFRKKRKIENPLLKELHATRLELETAYSIFENAVDPDLVSSSIYRINAVQERYQFLLKQIKKTEAALQSL